MVKENSRLILVCEESETYYSLESHLLSRHGYYALKCSETNLVDEVRRQRPTLLVLGLTPKGAPLELVIDIRADPDIRRTSVLATGIRGHITRDAILRQGANAVLWKPFSPERFLKEVDRLANIRQRHRAAFDVSLRKVRSRARAVKGTSVNISESGILLWAERNLEEGNTYVLEGSVTRGGFALDAQVVRKASELGPGYYALKFRQEPEMVRKAIVTLDLADDPNLQGEPAPKT